MKKVFNICFFFLIGLFCLYMYVLTKKSSSFIVDLSEDLKYKNDTIMMYKSFVDDINVFVSYPIANCEITNVNTGVKSNLYELLSTNVIIYKMTYSSCASCIAEQIDLIKYLQKFENVIVLSQNSNLRHLRLFLKENQISTDIYHMENSLKLFEDDNNVNSILLNVNKYGDILSFININFESNNLLKIFLKRTV